MLSQQKFDRILTRNANLVNHPVMYYKLQPDGFWDKLKFVGHAILPLGMFIKFLGGVWRHMPGFLRRNLVRTGQSRFTVTAGAMIFDDQNRILLLEHVFRPEGGWGIPGGFLNKGEQPEAALRRELREEIGIELEQVEFLFARTLPKPGQIEIYFRARALGKPEPCSFEIKQAGWFALDNLPPDLSKDQRRLIERTLTLSENSHQ